MDPNNQTPTPINPQSVNPVSQVQPTFKPQTQPVVQSSPPPVQKGGRKMLKFFIFIIILAILGFGGFLAYSYFNSQKTYNANVYNYPTSVPVSPTPTDVLNPNDISDSSIDSNNQLIDQNLKALDTDLNSVNEGINDKPTNLQ